jgi:hypothetical protein
LTGQALGFYELRTGGESAQRLSKASRLFGAKEQTASQRRAQRLPAVRLFHALIVTLLFSCWSIRGVARRRP